MRLSKAIAVSLVLLPLSGCETLNPPAPGTDPDFAPTYPTTPDPKEVRKVTGAIYSAETVVPFFETDRARHAGDILTVVLVENTNAQQDAKTNQTKNDQVQSSNPLFFGQPISIGTGPTGTGYNLDMNLSNQRTFTGEGKSVQYNKLTGSISVTVAKVLANGNLVVQGEKWIRINQAKEYVRLSGLVRPRDIAVDNSVTSDRVANARIYYGGVGQVNATNAQGWLTKFLWGSLYPT